MEKKSILIVEDEQIPAVDLKDTLISLGYRVTGIASAGERAIEMVDEEAPDLILMDVRLAGKLTGIEAAEQILLRHSIPIIYLTAYADPELVERAKKTRPYGYLIKPYDERGIRTEIEIALYKAELDRELKREYANLEQRVKERTNELTRINVALQKSETRYRLLFERSGEGIFIFEAGGKEQGTIVEVNAAGAAMHGYLPEELLSLKITDLDVADNLAAAPSRFDAILKGEWIGGVVNHVKKDGSVFPVDFHAGLLELDGHNYVFLVIRDISERTKAEDALKESEKKYRTILENIQDLFYRTDLKGKITMVSPAGARMAGYDSPDELVGMDVSVIHADPEKRTQLLADLTVSGAVYDYPLTLKSKDGSFRYGLTNSHFYRDAQGTVLGVEGIIHDITVLRQAEDALRMANKKLTLLSGITRHDIKNQLMALKSFIYLSKENLENPGQLAGYLTKEAMIADTIERQINFTSDYENLGVKSPAWQNIEAIVNRAVSQHPLREIHIETVCPGVEIYADPLLEKVFFNLIDNALKYGGQNLTSIRITSEVVQNGLVISVRDDGGGIPADDKKKLFERGFGHHTGLGLFLSREILSITGITITETGEPGKGARFEILVPNGGYRSGDAADIQQGSE
ncbi:MAG: PAS domain S-box protein [Methanoregula sp.]|nr:PAS domain S-box protein [Methanoregula sp.]